MEITKDGPGEKPAKIEYDQSIVFTSESQSEKLRLKAGSLILLKAAENYVEIHFRDEEKVYKKLLRTTLKNVENITKQYSFLIRCHRNCIINISYVEQLRRTSQGFRLIMKNYDEDVAVSRQYILFVRNALNQS